MNWIKIEDRLPEEHQDILVYYNPHSFHFPDARYMTQSSFYDNEFEMINDRHEVTHWQPLPEPPTE
jgi:hypothetical protein